MKENSEVIDLTEESPDVWSLPEPLILKPKKTSRRLFFQKVEKPIVATSIFSRDCGDITEKPVVKKPVSEQICTTPSSHPRVAPPDAKVVFDTESAAEYKVPIEMFGIKTPFSRTVNVRKR